MLYLVRIFLDKRQTPRGKEPSGGTVDLAGRTVAYTVRKSARAKNLRLQVSAEAGLEVVLPKKFNPGSLESILREKQNWILDKLNFFSQAVESRRVHREQGGWRVLYRGREYAVETKEEAGAACRVEVEEAKLIVVVPEGAGGNAGAVLEGWFRSMARLLIHQRLRVVNERLKLSFKRVFIRGQKTRWGSCSSQGNLNFNWRLVMAPLPVLEYVVVHELMHLVEPNHSKKFWSLVEDICPDYKAHRTWLRKNGHRLRL